MECFNTDMESGCYKRITFGLRAELFTSLYANLPIHLTIFHTVQRSMPHHRSQLLGG